MSVRGRITKFTNFGALAKAPKYSNTPSATRSGFHIVLNRYPPGNITIRGHPDIICEHN